jgi:hypothetical protein
MNILRSSSDRRPAGTVFDRFGSAGSRLGHIFRQVRPTDSTDRFDRQIRPNCSRPAAGVRPRSSNGGGGQRRLRVLGGLLRGGPGSRPLNLEDRFEDRLHEYGRHWTTPADEASRPPFSNRRTKAGRTGAGTLAWDLNACRRFVEFTKGPGLTHFPAV